MSKKVLAFLMVVAVAGVALGSLWLSAPGDADASGHSATRSFSSSSVDPGEEVTVTIRAENYGGFGQIVETLPSGFTNPDANGQTLTIILFGVDQTETYTVTASDDPGPYTFSGVLQNEDKIETPVGGPDTVTVNAPPPTPDTDPSATRSFSATSVDPGEEVTVTIRADNYGGFGRIVETLPSGFTSPDASGQTLTIILFGVDQTETYTVTASDNPGRYNFSGVLQSEDKSETPVGGPGTVTVNAPQPTPDTDPSATRSFSATSVDSGEEITVTIRADNYGGLGRIVETLPSGFTSPDASGQTVTIRFLSAGPQTETYIVTASDNPGRYNFSGVLQSEDKSETPVGGPDTMTVNAPPPTPDTDPSATRSFSATSVDAGEEITVTIRADNYGGLGRIVETLPSGFTSPDASGQTVTIRFLSAGPQTETYIVTASDNPGRYNFSGVLQSEDKSEAPVGGLGTVTVNAPPGPSARRSFSTTSVDPGGTVTVTIRADNYGGLGRIVETLPSGFTSPDASGQTVTLRLLQEGPQTRRYTVTASDNPGIHSFSGVLESEDKSETQVDGPSSVRVRRPSPPPPPPTQNRAPKFPGATDTRSIDEESAAGTNVGNPVTASDRDRDTLTYTLSGTDASSFSIGSRTGQVTVGTGTMLDFEDKASYMITVTATDPDNASGTISVTVTVGNVDEQGRVTLWAGTAVALTTPSVDQEILAQVEDSDGNPGTTTFPIPMYAVITAGNVTGWQWARADAPSDGSAPTADATWTDISGAMNAAYTPAAADSDKFLKATAMYTDGEGPGKTAMGMTGSAVVATPTTDPVAMYDTDSTAGIQKAEFETALRDYIFNQTLDKAGFEQVLRSYLGL